MDPPIARGRSGNRFQFAGVRELPPIPGFRLRAATASFLRAHDPTPIVAPRLAGAPSAREA